MMRFSEIAELVESARNHVARADNERKIKESYLVKRKNNDSDSADDDSDDEAGMLQGRERRPRVLCVLVFQSKLLLLRS
jgi:hypothetical protein